MIDPDKSFFLYARVTVEYNGRARSVIGPVNLTIMHKVDGALVIHGANGCLPVNYQRPKSVLSILGNILLCQSKDEQINVIIHEILHYYEIKEWSSDKLKMKGTEKQLCDTICNNIDSILKTPIIKINREMPVRHGSIDILATGKEMKHIIEVKRKRATKSAVFQLRKYMEDFSDTKCIGYVAAPEIGKEALGLMKEFGYIYLDVKEHLVF